jgi:geranylgeranyl reductase family protein
VPFEVDVAGSAVAFELASRGHSVLVAEKKHFPREKTCGDGLTPRAVKELEAMGLGEELSSWERVKGLRVHAGNRSVEVEWPQLDTFGTLALVKPRKDLDRIVLSRAEEAGAKVVHGMQAKEPVFEGGVVKGLAAIVDGQKEEIRAKYVVCAEGAATKFTRSLGRTRDADYPMGLAIRQYFRSPMQHSGWFEAFLSIKAGKDALPGYGWVFPVGDGTVNCGVGLLNTFGGWRDVNLHDLQDSFVAQLPESWGIDVTTASRPRGGRLFMGGSVWPPVGPGFLMVGDAAGMINPCNGEGIAYGYETGRMAGRHLHEALTSSRPDPVLDGYRRELETVYGPYYRLGRRFVGLIGHPILMEKLVSLSMMSKSVMRFAMTLLANLEAARAETMEQRGFKLLKKLAEVKP